MMALLLALVWGCPSARPVEGIVPGTDVDGCFVVRAERVRSRPGWFEGQSVVFNTTRVQARCEHAWVYRTIICMDGADGSYCEDE